MTCVEAVLGADGDFSAGEARFTAACYARDSTDLGFLLDVLGLRAAEHRWDLPRAVRLALTRCRHGRFTAGTVQSALPDRARHFTGPALTAMRRLGLARRTGTAATVEGRRAAAWELTDAGRDLSDRLRGAARPEPYTGDGWLLYDR